MRPAPISVPRRDEHGWLREAAIRSYAVARERDPVRQRSLIAADVLVLLDADAIQRFQLRDESGRSVEVSGQSSPALADEMAAALLPAALAAGKSMFSGHPRLPAEFADLARRCYAAGISTHLLLVRAHSQTHGAYAVHWLGHERPSREVRSGFYHYWDTIGIALAAAAERERLQDELEELSRYAYFDSLTGLPNSQALERELAANAETETLALLALDFDGLREANAALGYTAGGDLLIRTVGGALRTFGRPGEFTARMYTAGDEFALLIPGLDEQAAAHRAAELEAALDALEVPETHRGLYHGASVGHASRRPGETPGQVLGRAIETMRAQKRVRALR
jgi:diguanylate cyclase (GGDEF)-like protein